MANTAHVATADMLRYRTSVLNKGTGETESGYGAGRPTTSNSYAGAGLGSPADVDASPRAASAIDNALAWLSTAKNLDADNLQSIADELNRLAAANGLGIRLGGVSATQPTETAPVAAQPASLHETQSCEPMSTSSAGSTSASQQGSTPQEPTARMPPQELFKRPPRIPPQWLQDVGDGKIECPTSDDDVDHLLHGSKVGARGGPFSATNTAFEEHWGETLLGECKCPFLEGVSPPADWEGFDCGDYDWRILSELAPWWDTNMTHEALDLAASLQTANILPTYHFSVHRGKIYVKTQTEQSRYHAALMDMLRSLEVTVALPDVEFVSQYWDHAKVPRQDPIPVFGFARDAGRTDITLPFSYNWDEGSHDFNWELKQADEALKVCPPYENRTSEKLVWRGDCTGPILWFQKPLWKSYLRYRITHLTREHPDLLDAGLIKTSCGVEGIEEQAGPPLEYVYMSSQFTCQQKFLLLLDGNSVSGRSSKLFQSGSVVFKPDSIFSEWFYHLLKPWVHYVPVREQLEDLVEQVQWVKDHPKAGACIAANAQRMAKKHLNKYAVACVWWRILSTLAKMQPQKSRAADFVPVSMMG